MPKSSFVSIRSLPRAVGILYLDDNAASSEIGRVPVLGSIDMVSELASRGIQIAVVVKVSQFERGVVR